MKPHKRISIVPKITLKQAMMNRKNDLMNKIHRYTYHGAFVKVISMSSLSALIEFEKDHKPYKKGDKIRVYHYALSVK